MLIILALFAVLIVGLPAVYAVLVHRRDLREKEEARKEAAK